MFYIKAVGAISLAMMLTAVAAETVETLSPCTFAGSSEVTGEIRRQDTYFPLRNPCAGCWTF